MFASLTLLLPLATLALSDAALATQSVKITRNLGGIPSIRSLMRKERARIKTFGTTTSLLGIVPAINQDVAYTVEVTIGNQTFNLIVDTGSSNTWVGAGNPYNPGPTSSKDGRSVSVTYGSGSFSGVQYNDTLVFGNVSARDQSITVATYTQDFDGVDGILGLGPEALTAGTITGSRSLIPTVMQTLDIQDAIEQNILGVYFQPLTGENMTELNGELSFGGPDVSRYIGNITYTNVTSTQPYSSYWGIDIDALSHDDANSTTLIRATSAIVDTGTTLTYIPTTAMNGFLAATNGSIDPETTLPIFLTKPSGNITFTINNTPFSLAPDQYLVPKEQYALFGLNQTFYYAWLGEGGASNSVNFIIGQKVLEHFYSVYDTTNNRVGLAQALPKGTKPPAGAAMSATSSARNMGRPSSEVPNVLA